MKYKILAFVLVWLMIFSSISVSYAENSVQTYPVLNQSFEYALTYSGVQGGNNWYYMAATVGADDYSEMPMYVQTDAYGSGGWKKSVFNWEYGIISPTFISSGSAKDPVLAFKAPVSGSVNIDMTGGLLDKRPNGDGMKMNIYKDGTSREKLFPSGSEEFFNVPYTPGTPVVTPFETILNVQVTAGDMIYIRVNKGTTTSDDNLYINPKITYTSNVGVYLQQNYFMLNVENGTGEALKIPYSGNAERLSWESSSPSVAEVSDQGVVTARSAGSAVVTLTAETGADKWISRTNIDVVNKINPSRFQDGDIIGLWGDSITHAGMYGHNITMFYAAKYPEIEINIAEFGYSGDTTQDILNRVDRDFDTRPDINKATIMLGANDVAIENTAQNNYYGRMVQIIRKLKAKGVSEITVFTPTPYDGIRSGNAARANQIKNFAYEARRVASDEGCAIVDTWAEMTYYDTIMKTGYPISSTMPTVLSDDNLHPRDLGHFVIARAFLKAQGVMPLDNTKELPRLSLNAASGVFDKAENCSVSGLNATVHSASFSYTPNVLPFPVIAGYKQFKDITDIAGELKNNDLFKVTGLESGNYNVSINGISMGKVSSKYLNQGINLAALENSPIQAYAKSISSKTEAIHTLDFYLITNILVIETKYLGLTSAVSVQDGIAAANAKAISGSWTVSMRDNYIAAKNSEASKRAELASAWQGLYDIVRGRKFDVSITKEDAVKPHYDANADMSGVQGQNCWYYKYSPVGKFTLADYSEYSYYDSANKLWMYANGNFQDGRIRNNSANNDQSPGNVGDSARVFAAPANGRIRITMKDNKLTELGATDASRFRIYKNDQVVYPADGSWLTLRLNEAAVFNGLDLDVSEGDQIIFRVNKGSNVQSNSLPDSEGNTAKNDGDKLSYLPIIDYIEFTDLPFEVYDPKFSRVGGDLNIGLSIKNANEGVYPVKVSIVKYNGEKVVGIKVISDDLAGYLTSFENKIPISDCEKVKVFIWDNFGNINPLSDAGIWIK